METKEPGDGVRFVFVSLHSQSVDEDGNPIDLSSVGLGYLSSILKSHGHRPHIIYLRNLTEGVFGIFKKEYLPYYIPPYYPILHFPLDEEDIEIMLSLLDRINPDVFGITVPTMCKEVAVRITRAVRDAFDIPILWGGGHAMQLPLDSLKYADAISIRAAERTIVDVAKAIEKGDKLDNIPGLWVRRKDGTVVKNPPYPVDNLDSLPYPDMDVRDKYYINHNHSSSPVPLKRENIKIYTVISSRGCPMSCAYCCVPRIRRNYDYGDFVKRREPRKVMEELLEAKRNFPKLGYIIIQDDIFVMDRKWLKEFLDMYKQEINLPYFCEAYPTSVTPDIARMLRESNCGNVYMGIQSGSRRILREYFNRPTPHDAIKRSIEIMHGEGLDMTIDLIIDTPYETDSDLRETFDLYMELPKGFNMNMNPLVWAPETDLTDRGIRDGFVEKGKEIPDDLASYDENPTISRRYNRSPEKDFWYTMIALTQTAHFSRRTLRWLSKSRWLKVHPEALHSLVKFMYRIKGKRVFLRED